MLVAGSLSPSPRGQNGEGVVEEARRVRLAELASNDGGGGDDHHRGELERRLEAVAIADIAQQFDDETSIVHARERARVARQRLHHGD
jgi:hypothetical protein